MDYCKCGAGAVAQCRECGAFLCDDHAISSVVSGRLQQQQKRVMGIAASLIPSGRFSTYDIAWARARLSEASGVRCESCWATLITAVASSLPQSIAYPEPSEFLDDKPAEEVPPSAVIDAYHRIGVDPQPIHTGWKDHIWSGRKPHYWHDLGWPVEERGVYGYAGPAADSRSWIATHHLWLTTAGELVEPANNLRPMVKSSPRPKVTSPSLVPGAWVPRIPNPQFGEWKSWYKLQVDQLRSLTDAREIWRSAWADPAYQY